MLILWRTLEKENSTPEAEASEFGKEDHVFL